VKDLILRPRAKLDVEGAALWYESKREGLGLQFLEELDYVMNRVGDNPLQFPENNLASGADYSIDFRTPYTSFLSRNMLRSLLCYIFIATRIPLKIACERRASCPERANTPLQPYVNNRLALHVVKHLLVESSISRFAHWRTPTMKRHANVIWALALVFGLAAGCSSPAPDGDSGSLTPAAPSTPVSVNKDDYPVFPDADAGADPSVPADQGGKGFTGEGWETNTGFDLLGDPRALKGGVIRDHMLDFPGTLRMEGPESNTVFNYGITAMAYEGLLGLHTSTMQFIPSLATHWQVSQDKMTYRFRINPNARFADGNPVTAEDVVATFGFMMDPGLQAASNQLTFGKLERPVAESKYIVRVKSKELNWRNFLYFSGMSILPAHILKTVNGAKYIQEYNFKLLPGSGPYTIREEDVIKGKSITARRRPDYWAAKARASVGLGNFDEIRYVVVRDENLAFEMFKKGELDYFGVGRAKQWVEETNFDTVQRGLVQKRKIFNSEPWGFSGFAINTRRAPFDDIRVRKAFTFLTNRQLMIEKLAYNEYVENNSYYPSSVYENPNNPKNPYDPQLALKLLAEAGWTSRDSQGRIVRNGQPLTVEMLYPTQTFEPYLTVYQEDLRKVGITINLRLVTPETSFQMINERRFQMMYTGWGGLLFPNPETSFHSRLADQNDTNNITGFKNARADELFKQYDTMFDVQERIRAIREVDGLIANDYQYVLLWTGPFTRVLYWNKFGTPPGYWSRTGDAIGAGSGPGLIQMWWIDPARQAQLEQAQRDSSVKLEVGAVESRYWLDFEKNQQQKPATAGN
jgi:microcin C transport system substrate-binding protein